MRPLDLDGEMGRDLDLELLASMLDRDTLTQAVRDFRKALHQR